MPKQAPVITVSEKQRSILEGLCRAQRTPQGIVKRIEIIVEVAKGGTNTLAAQCLGTYRRRIQRWRDRWSGAQQRLTRAEEEGATDKELKELILRVVSDEQRPGAPATFTPEQITHMIALACEKPRESGLPVSHWTPPELAREAVRRGIVDRISARHLDRFLKRGRLEAAQVSLLADVA